jgi:molecular chaperone IbpA
MTLDLQPFFRSTIGFDQIAELLEKAATSKFVQNTYPPYNIERLNEDVYQISIAVAGFKEEDLEIIKHNNVLKVTGTLEKQEKPDKKIFLYKGMATRSFNLNFNLADHMDIKGVSLTNGVLLIELFRFIPEDMKPQKIKIRKMSSQ